VLFSQIDLLAAAEQRYNLSTAVNSIKAQYDFIPPANLYKQALEDQLDSSIADYDTEMESQTPYAMPWTDSDVLVAQILHNDLLKMGHGDKIIAFSVPLKWIDELDIYTNFRFQNPYGLSWNKSGEQGRYYYIISLEADYQNQIINIEAVDLQWLLRQYAILGDEDSLAHLWADAGENERIYEYLADEATGEFSDGESCKILIDENII